MTRAFFFLALGATLCGFVLWAAAVHIQQQKPTGYREQVIKICVEQGLLTRAGCELGYDATEPKQVPALPPLERNDEPMWSAL